MTSRSAYGFSWTATKRAIILFAALQLFVAGYMLGNLFLARVEESPDLQMVSHAVVSESERLEHELLLRRQMVEDRKRAEFRHPQNALLEQHEGIGPLRESHGSVNKKSPGSFQAMQAPPAPPAPPPEPKNRPAPGPHVEGWQAGAQDRYLRIEWQTYLGFNNLRFQLEVGLTLAQILQRRLILPTSLSMRACNEETSCSHSVCFKMRGSYRCPLTSFFDPSRLAALNAITNAEFNAMGEEGLTTRVAPADFNAVYDKAFLWLDSLKHLESETPGGFLSEELGCELAHGAFTTVSLEPGQRLRGFREEFADLDADVLEIRGTSHRIGRFPVAWSSRERYDAFLRPVWLATNTYHPEIRANARQLVTILNQLSPSGTFVCVHLRRGDFVSANWLGAAKNLTLVAAIIDKIRDNPRELFYIATDESSDDVLAPVLDLGVVRWNDLVAYLGPDTRQPGALTAFGDYIGLIEQEICASARRFVGSQCSSFTGGIFNIRNLRSGDTRRDTVTSLHDAQTKKAAGPVDRP
eukprot:m.59012 g.59012  ORF g.59012 m.59012 type:complete len:524 (-) comp7189_c0_seq1:225-1796(-)